ncbi:hypothetical protein PVAP13_9KG011900 [Panicum virgatum]|uniref:Aspartate transaminase n=1 Tax=Panicum virgatum TaxID=38727 RepID=A0A8T0N873_PANVG|nr:hypothetical protein PVAP13_9KG011900 [Panicum virgatum]
MLVLGSPARTDRLHVRLVFFFLFLFYFSFSFPPLSRSPFPFLPSSQSRAVQRSGCADGARHRERQAGPPPTYSSPHRRISADALVQLVHTVVAAGCPRLRSAAPSPSGDGFRRLRPHLAGSPRRRCPVQGAWRGEESGEKWLPRGDHEDVDVSRFEGVPMAPPDPILGVSEVFKTDKNDLKLNLGVGAYRTEELQPYVLNVVKKAENLMLEKGENKESYCLELTTPSSSKDCFCSKSSTIWSRGRGHGSGVLDSL